MQHLWEISGQNYKIWQCRNLEHNTKQVICVPHEGKDCKLCFRQKIRQKNLDFKSIDAELRKCHFHKTEVDLKDYITGQIILYHGVL